MILTILPIYVKNFINILKLKIFLTNPKLLSFFTLPMRDLNHGTGTPPKKKKKNLGTSNRRRQSQKIFTKQFHKNLRSAKLKQGNLANSWTVSQMQVRNPLLKYDHPRRYARPHQPPEKRLFLLAGPKKLNNLIRNCHFCRIGQQKRGKLAKRGKNEGGWAAEKKS